MKPRRVISYMDEHIKPGQKIYVNWDFDTPLGYRILAGFCGFDGYEIIKSSKWEDGMDKKSNLDGLREIQGEV